MPAVKERALAALRLLQVREKRKEWNRIVDAGNGRGAGRDPRLAASTTGS